MGRDKIHPTEHDSSTFYRFQGSQTPSRKGGTLAQAIQSRVSALFPDTFSDGKRRLSNIWQIKLVPSRDRIATIVSWINSAAFDASIRSSNPRLTPFRIHFVTRSRKIRPSRWNFAAQCRGAANLSKSNENAARKLRGEFLTRGEETLQRYRGKLRDSWGHNRNLAI